MNIHSMRSNRFVSKEYVRSTADITSRMSSSQTELTLSSLGVEAALSSLLLSFFFFFVVAAGGKNVPSFHSNEK